MDNGKIIRIGDLKEFFEYSYPNNLKGMSQRMKLLEQITKKGKDESRSNPISQKSIY